jgi:hypothetical protein
MGEDEAVRFKAIPPNAAKEPMKEAKNRTKITP